MLPTTKCKGCSKCRPDDVVPKLPAGCVIHPEYDDTGERGNWTNKAEFLLSMIGYAVGLGNVWRFPYLAFENGGGAFLLPYLTMLVLAGLPIFFLEVSLGQFCSQGPLGAFNGVPIVKGLGVAMVVVSVYVGVYYNVVICYTLYFLFSSLTSELPWDSCNNDWNTPACLHSTSVYNMTLNFTLPSSLETGFNNSQRFNTTRSNFSLAHRISPSEEYWNYKVLEKTKGIENLGKIRWELALILLLAWIIIYACLIKGVKSSGKAVYFTATFPYVVLTVLLIRGLTLDGAMDGVRYFFEPKWEKLLTAKVWKDAATQIFYSLSASWGGLITLSSYNKFNNNCYRDSVIVVLTNSFTSIFAGVTIFAVIGFMAHVLKTDIASVAADGPGLAFVVYPEALSQMPFAPVWSVLFFLMLFTLGLDTMFATLETIVTSLTDACPRQLRHRKCLFTLAVCIFLFLIGLPLVTQGGFFYLHLLDSYVASYSLIVCAIVEMLSISYIYGLNRFCEDIKMMTGHKPNAYWKVTWSVISPAVLTFILIYSIADYKPLKLDEYNFPLWANILGWFTVASSVMCIPIFAIREIARNKGTFLERIKSACRPHKRWGPYLKKDRVGFYAFNVHPPAVTNVRGIDNDSDATLLNDTAQDTPSTSKRNLNTTEAVSEG
ncbi:sodium- and chloride-dependent glycine transporter 2 [Ciona intestinalis]